MFQCKSTALCVTPCNFVTSGLRSRLLQHKVTPLFISGYQTTLHDCKKQATQSNSTAPIVTPVFPYYIPFVLYLTLRIVIFHYTRHSVTLHSTTHDTLHSTRTDISRQFNTSTNKRSQLNTITYKPYNTIHGQYQTAACFGAEVQSSVDLPEQRHTSTVRLYTWISVLDLYVFVLVDPLRMALRCRNM